MKILKKIKVRQIFQWNIFKELFVGEVMTTLLQFFFDYKCIGKKTLFKWYNRIKKSRYEGLEQAKELAKPFIQSFSRQPIGKISF